MTAFLEGAAAQPAGTGTADGEAAAGRAATELRPGRGAYLSVALVAGSIIALQIAAMRIFSVGSWAHFGSLVISVAMLGFGLTSVVMAIARPWFERHWRGVIGAALALFGPLTVVSAVLAQKVPFNAIFLVSDPAQKWRLAANFGLYLLPFLAGATFLGTLFLKTQRVFGRVYFADLTGSGLAGLLVLAGMFLLPPEWLLVVPLGLWAVGGFLWFAEIGRGIRPYLLAAVALATLAAYAFVPGEFGVPRIAVNDYKGIAYAQKFPDAKRIYRDVSPFGDLQIYASSYLHFAPGLSDNAAFNLPEVPRNSYLGMYIDGEGPIGIMRNLTGEETKYFHYLPMVYPYLLKKEPETFVVQFGGGISTMVALRSGSSRVTVAEGNPAILAAFRDPQIRAFTGDILADPKIEVIPYDGRIFLANTERRFDVVDLSLADSAGLSNPGGFAIVEKYAYAQEAMESYMRALKPGGILSVTLWNKEEPPKSVLKLYATLAGAAKALDEASAANSFFAFSSYLSTATVLYKRGGFTAEEVARLREQTASMSFDELTSPGFDFDPAKHRKVIADFEAHIFGSGEPGPLDAGHAAGGEPDPATEGPSTAGSDGAEPPADEPTAEPATTMGRLAWHYLLHGGWPEAAEEYVFDTRPLTNSRPYFAAYVKVPDLPRTLDRLEIFQDEWGYLLLWATLGIACIAAVSLIVIPVVGAWKVAFSKAPGKLGTIVYFACLGAGYIMVEVALINHFMLALSNPTVSASILITGMLVFSGLGSLVSERFLGAVKIVLPLILLSIGALLVLYGLYLDLALDWIGTFPYLVRLGLCFLLVAPPAFLMGFPMPTAMTWLGKLGKDTMFVWAWGINGCFSVIGAAAVPLIATAFGLGTVLEVSGGAYWLAIPVLFAVLLPRREAAPRAA